MNIEKKETAGNKPYKYRPVLFFTMAYFFTWIFWIPATFLEGNIAAALAKYRFQQHHIRDPF